MQAITTKFVGPATQRTPIMLYDGSEITHAGNRFRVTMPTDDNCLAPWERDDFHGPVRDAPHGAGYPAKRAGERELGEHWLYDFAGAVAVARRAGWGASDNDRAMWVARGVAPTVGMVAASAAELDFKRLSDWCADRWNYIGVVVTLLDDAGDATDETASLWGIESDAGDYLEAVARELADDIAASLKLSNAVA